MPGTYESISYITATFNNQILQQVAGDSLPLLSIFTDDTQDTIDQYAYANLQHAIVTLLEMHVRVPPT
jgi:hypothetical protein